MRFGRAVWLLTMTALVGVGLAVAPVAPAITPAFAEVGDITTLDWADANGLFDGFIGGTRFKPERAATRGQVADVVFRLARAEAAWPQDSGDPAPPSTVLF